MPNIFKTPNAFDLEKPRLKLLIEDISRRIQSREIETEAALFSAVYNAYIEVYNNLDHPKFEAVDLDQFDLRTVDIFNVPFKTIYQDLKSLLNTTPLLSSTIQKGFNYIVALEEVVKENLKLGQYKTIDLNLIGKSLKSDLIVAGDSFQDLSRVLPSSTAEISPFGNYVSLKRVSVDDITQSVSDIKVQGPQGMYEGKLYALAGQARAEGEKFQFTKTNGNVTTTKQEGVSPELISRYEAINAWLKENPAKQIELGINGAFTPEYGKMLASNTGTFGGITKDEYEQIAGNFHYTNTFTSNSPPVPFDPTAEFDESAPFKLALVPATEEQKKPNRNKIFDKNADTFWECELVKDTSNNFNRVKLYEDTTTVKAVPEKDIEVIKTEVEQLYDTTDLDVTVTVLLNDEYNINLINVHPYLTDATQVLEILEVSTSIDGSVFEKIDDINNNKFETKIGADTNTELSSEELVYTLSGNKTAYTGQAVFSFPTRTAKAVRIKFRQAVPVPVPYSVLKFILTRTVTTHYKKDGGLFGKTRRWSETENFSKSVDLDYLESLYLFQNESLEKQLTGVTDPTQRVSRANVPFLSSTSKDLFKAGGVGTVVGSILAAPLAIVAGLGTIAANAIVGALFGGKIRRTTTDTGWQIAEISDPPITKFDKARYSIGLREMGIARYLYSPVSELVSTVYRSPKPIESVSLEVDEQIPEALQDNDSIEYYFSLDGQTWNRIAPLLSTPRRENNGFVPQVYRVNSGISPTNREGNIGYIELAGQPAYQVQLKAVLKGGGEGDLTPILKSYRLLLSVSGGLRN